MKTKTLKKSDCDGRDYGDKRHAFVIAKIDGKERWLCTKCDLQVGMMSPA